MALDLLDRQKAAAALLPRRRIHCDQKGSLALLEIADGDGTFIGPEVAHGDLERLARELLSCTGPGAYLPPMVHKLCLGYLAARGIEVVS
jgi:hypothetical protein